MSDARIRVAVVDDQPLFSAGLRMLIEAQDGMDCVGTALDGEAAVALNDKERPDIMLMDLRMPVMNGLDATRRISASGHADETPGVIVLTTIKHDLAVYDAFQAGASAFLTKDATPDQVIGTIRDVHGGHAIPDVRETLAIVHDFGRPAPRDRHLDVLEPLTQREREVFLLLARGLTNAEIADAGYISEATVKSHVRGVLQKLNLRSRAQVVVFAYENNLVAL